MRNETHRQSGESWQYQLRPNEANILKGLIQQFPFTAPALARSSKTATDPAAVERDKLLNESLAEHRQELKKLALTLLREEFWQPDQAGPVLTLDAAGREILLQLLNDIRLGAWQALGAPEGLDTEPIVPTMQAFAWRNLMDLAGYFEMQFLEPEA